MKNNLDKQYTDLLQDILDNGIWKEDRTGTGTKSVFGRQIRHKMSEGFPLLTTKKMPWKVMVTELIWFLKGDTNIQYLVQNGCNIWNGDCYAAYLKECERLKKMNKQKHLHESGRPFTKEEFVELIKFDDEFAKEWGELGPIYGAQWRNWEYGETKSFRTGELYPSGEFKYDFKKESIDQIANLISDLKNNPDSRRLMVNAWNVGEIKHMTLPPCHYGFQCYTKELSYSERLILLEKKYDRLGKSKLGLNHDRIEQQIDEEEIPKRELSLIWNQRSVDTFLGLPFNIASYGLLLEILAKEVNMIPGELIGNLGDTHLYSNHIEQAKEQIGHYLNLEERKELALEMGIDYERNFNEIIPNVFTEGFVYDKYSIPVRTRAPFPLPSIEFSSEVKWKEGDCLPYYSPDDIKLKDYKSHGVIKAPLSN